MGRVYLIAIFLLLVSCSGGIDRIATYEMENGEYSISLELFHSGLILAEYERDLVIAHNGVEIIRKRLFPDTGGYTSSNLYRCDSGIYSVKGYFDSWIVNFRDGEITEGGCKGDASLFIGSFQGVGSEEWKFYTASQRKEPILKAGGG